MTFQGTPYSASAEILAATLTILAEVILVVTLARFFRELWFYIMGVIMYIVRIQGMAEMSMEVEPLTTP